jgi:hypothetical protein
MLISLNQLWGVGWWHQGIAVTPARAACILEPMQLCSCAAAYHCSREDKVQLVQAPVGPGGHVSDHRGTHTDDLHVQRVI